MTKSKTLRVQMVAAVTAMLLVSFMVVRTSSAAFTGSSSTSADTLSAGTVSLTTDTAGQALLDLTGLLPGFSQEFCVDVTYDGDTAPGNAVEFFGTGNGADAGWLTDADNSPDGTDLDDQIDISVYAADTNCTTHSTISAAAGILGGLVGDYQIGSTTDLASLATSASPLTSTWSPSGASDTQAFYIKVEFGDLLDSAVQNQAQGDTVTGSFTWQVEGSSS